MSETPPESPPEIPSGWRAALTYGLAATLLFFCGMGAGWAMVAHGWLARDVPPRAELEARLRTQANVDHTERFAGILANNLKATALLVLCGVVSAGLFSIFYVGWFGVQIGMIVGTHALAGVPGATIAAFLVPHGIVEMPALWLASGVGLRAGVLFFRYLASGALPEHQVVRQLVVAAIVSLALIPVAAVLEGYLTPAIGLRALG